MGNNLAQILRQINIVHEDQVNLKNAGSSNFYLDVKKAFGYPIALNLISEELWGKIDNKATCIAAAGYGGISPASVISSRHDLTLTLVRDEPKKYGKGGWIDGYLPNEEDRIALVDDVFTTGGSLKKMIDVLAQTKAKIIGAYVVIKRRPGELSIPLTYLLTPEDLI